MKKDKEQPFYVTCSKCKKEINFQWYNTIEQETKLKTKDFSEWICNKCKEEEKENIERKYIESLPIIPRLYKCIICKRQSYNVELFTFFKETFWNWNEERVVCNKCIGQKGFLNISNSKTKDYKIIIEANEE